MKRRSFIKTTSFTAMSVSAFEGIEGNPKVRFEAQANGEIKAISTWHDPPERTLTKFLNYRPLQKDYTEFNSDMLTCTL
jgi:hypothetical protein